MLRAQPAAGHARSSVLAVPLSMSVPPEWSNRWRVGAWFDEHPFAQRECEVLGYTTSEDGRHVCEVRLLTGTCSSRRRFPPRLLFPVLARREAG